MMFQFWLNERDRQTDRQTDRQRQISRFRWWWNLFDDMRRM